MIRRQLISDYRSRSVVGVVVCFLFNDKRSIQKVLRPEYAAPAPKSFNAEEYDISVVAMLAPYAAKDCIVGLSAQCTAVDV